MYKVKQKLTTLLMACFAVLVSMLLAVSLWTPTANIQASAATGDTYELVTNASSLAVGDQIIIVAKDSNVAMSTTQNGNNRGQTDITKNGNTVTITDTVQTIALEAGSVSGSFAFKVNNGYLTTASSSSNYLRTAATKSANASWSISISNGSATITGQGTYSRKIMQHNTSSKIFACYGSASQKAISIYKLPTTTCAHANTTETIVDATCLKAGSKTITCNDCKKEISTEAITKLDHTLETLDAKAPTCTETGLTEGKKCSVCNTVTVEQKTIPENGHNFPDPVYTSNDNGTHNEVGTCTVCGEEDSNVRDCEYERSEGEDASTYTCQKCEYTYNVAIHTVTFEVPNGIEVPECKKVEEGLNIQLSAPTESTEGYTFVGWVKSALDEKTESVPEYFTADSNYTVTEDVTFYALYSYAEGTGAWTMVKDASNLAIGKEIVIVASNYNYALSTTQNNNNRSQASISKTSDTITFVSNVQIITLEEGTTANTWAFHVTGGTGTNADDGYLYAASSSSNHLKTQTTLNANGSWAITIDSKGVATIKATGNNTNNWLRYNNSSSNSLFSCYGSGQTDVSIYMKDGTTYYVTEFNTCAHTNTNEVIDEATCTESGSRTVTCLDCESVIESEIIAALGHNYVDDICENCGKQDPVSIVYNGYYYLILNDKYLDATTLDKNDRYKPSDIVPGETIALNYVFRFVKNGETYDMYDLSKGLYMEGVTLTTNNDYTVNITKNEENIFSFNTTANYVGFYKTSNNYPSDFTFTKVELNAKVDSASLTIGEEISVNYYVTMSDAFADAKMTFTVDGIETAIDPVAGEFVDGRYVFSVKLAPQFMASNIKAELIFNGNTIAAKDTYSVKEYAQNKLNAADSSAELKQLVSDMLRYGAAAQRYLDSNTADEALATYGVENMLDAVNTEVSEDANNFSYTDAQEPAYFMGAGVYFDNVNKIFVKLSTTENVTLTINGKAVEITGTTVYTDGITATNFATEYTFVLSYNGEVVQTLTYTVNAYAFAKQGTTEMGVLAIALYNYGASATAYANAQN